MSHPLCELLSAKRVWAWGPSQDDAFLKLKCELTTSDILVQYNPESENKVSADTSSHGLGAVLLQNVNDMHLDP